ncbi:IS1634 family transposase [Adlercreutzia sp. ZJ138]|uniref:IS1634 family transposase n=1 Tax=Adlercreutzia sp. ZJ138 TaxID=2709405 RepID=UPI0013EBE6F1|nr:IS1634 family transposase [Adlercreutzia sp. ZJ138]
MYLKKTKGTNGRIHLSITESFRDSQGKARNRTVKTLGYLDELEKVWGPGALARCEAIRDELTATHNEAVAPVALELHMAQKVDKRHVNRMCAGDAVPMAYYNALGIEKALRNHLAGRKVAYDLNAVCRLLVSERLLAPGSKHAAWQRADLHFLRCDASERDVYRALDELAVARNRVIAAMNRAIAPSREHDLACGYYDCTNFYFECDPDGFREKGVSKEHRPNPIVQMGLLQDASGIPVTYRLFEGNVNDSKTLIEALPDLKEAAGMQRVVIVADKGMNCSDNIAAAVGKGDGFVFSQSVRGTKSTGELRGWVLSDEGYRECGGDGFKLKSRQDTKIIHVKGPDGKMKDVPIEVKVVAFWSRKYAERARHEREKVLEKSRQLVESPGKYTRATHYGAAQYVRNIDFDPKTGEVIECAKKPEIDWEAIAAAEACDGYYCIVTSETNWDEKRIIDAYRELWRIEESFKITKTGLEGRPAFVRTREHLEAHFLTCYIALTILRLIERALGHRYSALSILEDMRALGCSELEANIWLFDHRTDLTDELFALIGEESPRKYMRRHEIKALFEKGKQVRWR